MTRGNQRELARAKNLKKQQDAARAKNDDGLTPLQRKERDAAALKEKLKKKEESKQSDQGQAGGSKKK